MQTVAHGERPSAAPTSLFARQPLAADHQRRQLVGSIQQDYPPPKLTHKLAPMMCVLWLRDSRAYLRHADLVSGQIAATPNPDEARRLPEDEAEAFGQDVIDRTGVRVELRPYRPREVQLQLVER